jgi:hypothetical protein
MRTLIALCLLASAPAALAQPYAPPPGDYQLHCSNIRMNGQFLSAYCRGAHGAGNSSINVASCSTGIFVDDSGALTCVGPGGGQPPAVRNAPPGYATGQERGYYGGGSYYGDRRGRFAAELYPRPGWRGPPVRIQGAAPDLGDTGLNDRVRSIRIPERSGPWLVCTDAGFHGRCTTIWRSVGDTRELGMGDSISSIRPGH